MTTLNFNFVKRFKFPWLAVGLLALSIFFCADRMLVWMKLQEQQTSDEVRIARIQSEILSKKRAIEKNLASQRAAIVEQGKEEADVRRTIQYPWNRVLSTLEQADTERVAVLSFSHDAATSETRITVEAADVSGLEEFVGKLNGKSDNGLPYGWYLANYQVQSQNLPFTVIGTILEKK